jgi:hypothetical protein
VALVRTDVSEECTVSMMRVKRISELRKMLSVTMILLTLNMEARHSSETSFLTRARRLTTQKTAFLIVIAVKI